jgi:hypothetical protein
MTALATPSRGQLAQLARPFPRELVERDPGGNSYVAHENVTQWLLGIVGPFDFELREVIRGDVPGAPPDPQGRSRRAKEGTPDLRQVIVGGVWRLRLQIDGRDVVIEEVGDVEDPHNWRHDGMRLKQAASDAIKRCAMRAGLGLHLWAGERYVLGERLAGLALVGAAEGDRAAGRGETVSGDRRVRPGWHDLDEQDGAHQRMDAYLDEHGAHDLAVQIMDSKGYDGPMAKAQMADLRRTLDRELAERAGAVEQPGMVGGGEPPDAPAPADPSGEGASSPAPPSDHDASAAGERDTGVMTGRPSAVEAQTEEAAAGRAGETTGAAGSEGTAAAAAASTDLRGVGPVTAWCLERGLSPGTVRLFLARHHPAEFGRQGRWPVGNVSELDALREAAAARALDLAAKQFPKAGEPKGWEGGGG